MSDTKMIYIVEDEEDIAELVSVNLEKSSFRTKKFYDIFTFKNKLAVEKPDLIVLDLMLPDGDGLDVCRDLKENPEYRDIPVIILTAKSEEMDKVLGLELGADDYVTKPFSPRELVARVKNILKRFNKVFENEKEIIKISDEIKINTKKHEVVVDNEKIDLTATEFKILKILAKRKGWVFSREQILNRLWGNEKNVIDRTVDVHIRHLRKKLGDSKNIIKNVRGVGYKIDV
ncbi:MAG: response regulator transcription factor [Candidatus Mcinerneyibacterium aminivorans]|uniref:Response regulator transcription factor n=1 Tax=Candidatus Mcinerneyibacterium aminivorans TaxID=2703815 RepID=A0A5D0MEW0_9BACT|nr:MAG: response regulator transcription factor [Candidatus Mcinerneyibacterium aminivorans]